jgi:hypothetical protein
VEALEARSQSAKQRCILKNCSISAAPRATLIDRLRKIQTRAEIFNGFTALGIDKTLAVG